MRFTFIPFALLVVLAVVIGAVPLTPQEEDDVRGAFLTSRPKEKTESANATPKTSRRRPKTVVTPVAPKPAGPTPKPSATPVVTVTDVNKPGRVGDQRLGLGLTLFTRDSNGLAVRVDPTHVFHQGDRVRILLETNTDGYLYIFNTTDGGAPVMLYPDPQLDDAGNYIQSHVPFEIPSSASSEERLRWLVFDANAGNEKLFFVFTRDPIPGVPIDDNLISSCKATPCPWRPPVDVWNEVQKQIAQPVRVDRAQRYGTAQTDSEHKATTRGIGLAKDDPQPSLIMMVASSNTSVLITTLDLVHK